ncbi:ParA family protein [Sphingobacterium bovistauri]|uniref:ParA family protein n=1 Tax=Sphingobacterium bovistauri TaxID=2781959 RepID=A0ABS7Z7K3_9SPHI|nr:ParA family protein [Sphingobacterium bovistauri]MCA5006139.1 ParA family protein [Sphingobacterium bovistauri]
MVILIGNQKGGAGKSTITLLLANYLSEVQQQKVTVLDMDYQQSVSSKYVKAKILDNDAPYEVIPADLKHFPILLKVLTKNPNEIVLIDLPGKMDDDGLIPVILSGDLIISPFNYDELSVDSTLLFAMVASKINNQAPIVFIPNRIKSNVRYSTRGEVDNVLKKFGTVTSGISDRIDFQRVSTLYTPAIVLPVILPLFDLIYETYIRRKDIIC